MSKHADFSAGYPEGIAFEAVDRDAQVAEIVPFERREGAAIGIRGLRRRFGAREVLAGIDLDVGPREVLSVVGRSGCGKSTLLRIIGGLDRDYEGTVSVRGKTAIAFQDARLLPWLRAWQNVVFAGRERLSSYRETALDLLAEVGLRQHADSWPNQLSGGEAQRVSLARALAAKPDVLLLDEPFGALDALTRLQMQGLAKSLWRHHKAAAVLVTHDVEEAILLGDRIIVLEGGHIVDDVRVPDEEEFRSRSSPSFQNIRSKIMRRLGVE